MACLWLAAHALAEEELEFGETPIVGVSPLPGLGQPLERVPSAIQSLGREEVDRLAPLNTSDLLGRRVGGAHLTQTQNNPFQPDLTYRGFTSSPLLGTPQGISVFQDGTRVNEFLGDTMNWDLVPEDAIASLQVAPGANPVYGRNTLGAALALQTRRGRTDPETVGEVYFGSFDRRRLMVRTGGQRGDFDYLALASFFREDGFRDFSKSEVSQFFGQIGWGNGATDVNVTYTGARNELRGNGFAPESFLERDRGSVFTHPDVFEPDLDFANVVASHSFGPRLRLDGNAYYRRLRVSQFNADELDDDEEEEEEEGEEEDDDDGALGGVNRMTDVDQDRFGGGLQLTWSEFFPWAESFFVAGVDVDRGRGDLRFSEQEGFLNERRTVIATEDFALATDVETEGEAVGVFVTETLTPRPWLSLTASARFDRNRIEIDDRLEGDASGEHTFHRFNPSAGAVLRPWRRLHFFARYGESFRSPTAIELTCASEEDPCPLPVAFAEDPPLEKVTARTWEAGLRARPLRGVRASLSFFRTDLDDDILFVSTGRAEGFFRNVDETRRKGAELLLEGSVREIDWFAAYTYTAATFETTVTFPSPLPGNTARPGDDLPGVPNHLARAGFEAPLPFGFGFGFDVGYTGEQFLRTDEANRLDPIDDFVVANARLSWTRGPVTIFARAENLFDEEYETFGTFAENVFAGDRVERFLAPGAPLGGWFGIRVRI